MNDRHVELKVCEGCGVLWLRQGAKDGVYCAACVMQLSAFPNARSKRPGGRPRLARAVGCVAGRRRREGAQ
jgi:hypothetical protein